MFGLVTKDLLEEAFFPSNTEFLVQKLKYTNTVFLYRSRGNCVKFSLHYSILFLNLLLDSPFER